jgi:hypothetical protein
MSFGKYAVLQDVVHTFEKEPDWGWTIHPITMNEELSMAQFLARDLFVVMPDGGRAVRGITNHEIALREIALTFRSTNIPGPDDKSILPENASVAEVEEVLRTMPADMVLEIWKAVGEACPPWGPKKKDDEGAPKKALSKGKKS